MLRWACLVFACLHVFIQGASSCTVTLAKATPEILHPYDEFSVARVTATLGSDCRTTIEFSVCTQVALYIQVSGDSPHGETSNCKIRAGRAPPTDNTSWPQADGRRAWSGVANAYTPNSVAWVEFFYSGTATVQVFEVDGNSATSNTVTYGAAATASKLVISPAKAVRHVHDRVPVTAVALDAANAAVPGVPIAFAAKGDCAPSLTSATAVTDASGRATVYISASKPGAVAVVAAATSSSGARLMTPAAHVIFFGDQHHAEEDRERDYYGHGHRYAAIEARGEEEKPAADSDAERFAAEATRMALAQLPN